jgi:subtilisin family serine protease
MNGPATRRVVVIDSGVDAMHPAVRGRCRFVAGPWFDARGVSDPAAGGVDGLGHGTAVAATILQFPGDAAVELVSLRVFGDAPTCEFAAVLHALQHALELSPALVNLSLGTTSLRHRAPLQAWLAQAQQRGTRLVAPASYGGLPCDPGNLPGVEAVVADANVLPMLPELRPHGGRLLWFASPLPPRDADGLRRLTARGDSLATAAVTGWLLRRPPT